MTAAELAQLRNDIEQAGRDGLRLFAEAVLQEARRNIGVGDPTEDPDPLVALANAGRIDEHEGGLVVGFHTVYAAKQHEDQHLQHPRGGGPKYLERALTDLAPSAREFVASEIRGRLGGRA